MLWTLARILCSRIQLQLAVFVNTDSVFMTTGSVSMNTDSVFMNTDSVFMNTNECVHEHR